LNKPSTTTLPPSLARVLATVLLPFALAHFVSYLYRCVNAVVYPDLVRDVGLSANTLGLLTGAYFIAFAAAQLPVGIALDRFGPRRVQLSMLLVAALGGFLFAHADTLTGLVIARGLIGLGVAASLMSAIKACALWLPPDRLPLSTSVLLAVGGMGAVVSTAPMQWVLDGFGWRAAFVGLGLLTLLVWSLIVTLVPEHAAPANAPPSVPATWGQTRQSIAQLFHSRLFWRLSLCTLFSSATYMAVQSLWLGPWLRDVGHLPRNTVASVLFAGTVAMVVGSLTFGWVTDVLRRYRVQPLLVCGLGVMGFVLCQALMLLGNSPWVPPWLVAVGFSFFGTAGALNYAIIAQSVSPELTGRVSTCFNLLIFIATFAIQWGLGAIINQWPPVDGGYPEAAYRVGLAVSLVLQLPGMVLWLGFRPWRRVVG
jgi:predicted MFS family arabinose efflux permease